MRARPAIDALLEREVDDARRHVVAASTWIFICNPTTGALFYDADGNGAGAAVQFAAANLAPTNNDLIV